MTEPPEIRMIPIERITVLNPRERNKRVFGDIVTNIAHLGLKRPITVTRRDKGRAGSTTIWFAARAASKPTARSVRPRFQPW